MEQFENLSHHLPCGHDDKVHASFRCCKMFFEEFYGEIQLLSVFTSFTPKYQISCWNYKLWCEQAKGSLMIQANTPCEQAMNEGNGCETRAKWWRYEGWMIMLKTSPSHRPIVTAKKLTFKVKFSKICLKDHIWWLSSLFFSIIFFFFFVFSLRPQLRFVISSSPSRHSHFKLDLWIFFMGIFMIHEILLPVPNGERNKKRWNSPSNWEPTKFDWYPLMLAVYENVIRRWKN